MGRRQFALTLFYGGASDQEIDDELWTRDCRCPISSTVAGVSLIALVYGSIVILAVRWLFL